MIESNKIDAVKTTEAGYVKDINEAVRDSGIRLGVQIWELVLTNNQGDNQNPILSGGDTLTIDINGVTVTAAFATDVATTLSNFAANITAQPLVTAKVEKNNKVVITSTENVENTVENADVTGSTITQLTAKERSELTAVPAILVVNQHALEPLRTEVTGTAPNTTTYAGFALAGANPAEPVWRIQRITETATTTLIEYADGNENMDNVWNDRASLIYS
jgi:hypothetical protein